MSHLSRCGADDGERERTSHNAAHSYEVLHAQVLSCCFALEVDSRGARCVLCAWPPLRKVGYIISPLYERLSKHAELLPRSIWLPELRQPTPPFELKDSDVANGLEDGRSESSSIGKVTGDGRR